MLMSEIEVIKSKVKKIYQTNAMIRVECSVTRPKAIIVSHKAKIIGVYPNLFQVKSDGQTYSFSYTDILTHHIKITELQ